MPLPKELSFKSGAKYTAGQAFSDSYTSTEREQLRQLLVSPDIFLSRSAPFSVKYLDVYYKYEIPVTEGNIDVAHRWHNSQMDFRRCVRGGDGGGAAKSCACTHLPV